MNIGEFKIVNGRMRGWIATRQIDLPQLGLRQVESQHERAPLFEILALNVGNRWVQIGALWEAVARNSTGEVFLQGSIDDPSLRDPLSIALFGNEEDGFRVAWRRQPPRDVFAPVVRGGQRRDFGEQGGFGDSTAEPGGGMTDPAPELADDIAF